MLDEASWAVLWAIRELSPNPYEAVAADLVRAKAAEYLTDHGQPVPYDPDVGSYAGLATQIWALEEQGLLGYDPGMAQPVAETGSAHTVDDPMALFLTAEGRLAVTSRSA